ncbi:MAG: hypothetical protein MRY21_03975 [Simkaniaceae bacterium]|nr:hypothetical protein [Simkaniaceae bacterium]
MAVVTLKAGKYAATFLPTKGMNMVSLKKGETEAIDQTTKPLFDERFAGLGPVIGPHFHRQKDALISTDFDTTLFPHIARVSAKGTKDPFSHGIGRYAPWNYSATDTKISAHISGDDFFHGVPLKTLEGINFSMKYVAELSETGLHIHLEVSSEGRESLVGLHTYYAMGKKGIVSSHVKPLYNEGGEFKKIPGKWWDRRHSHLKFDLSNEADYGFLPLEETHGRTLLETEGRSLLVSYCAPTDNLSCQIYHPKDASYVCIEPLSAKNPRNLENSSSSIEIGIEIL